MAAPEGRAFRRFGNRQLIGFGARNPRACPRVSRSGTRGKNMRKTFRKLWLITVGALCLMAASSAAQEASGPKEPSLQSAPVSLQQRALKPPSVTVLGSRQAQSVLGKEVRTSAD